MTKSKMMVLLLVTVVIGCKKKESSDTAAKPATDDKAALAAKAPAAETASGPFGAWDMPARKAAWQGAWAGDAEAAGWKAAWQIDGDKVTRFDGKGEKQLELQVESPCSAKFVEKSANGSSSTTSVYTLQNGQLITGLGDAGSRKGDDAVVCGGGKIFTLDAKGCTEWADNFGKLESKPGQCGFRKDGEKEMFFYNANGRESVLVVEGDVIWSEQLKSTHAAKHPDLAAAKKSQGF